MSELRFLQLLHLADSALPVGAAAHSFGLEGLVAENGLEVGDLFPSSAAICRKRAAWTRCSSTRGMTFLPPNSGNS